MPKFGKYRIKNQLSCLIFENPALIPIQMQQWSTPWAALPYQGLSVHKWTGHTYLHSYHTWESTGAPNNCYYLVPHLLAQLASPIHGQIRGLLKSNSWWDTFVNRERLVSSLSFYWKSYNLLLVQYSLSSVISYHKSSNIVKGPGYWMYGIS